MESLRRDCKREFDSEFGNGRPWDCPQCGIHVNTRLSRHIGDFHLALGQLWRCPIPWCSLWKGTAQDCLDHIRFRHHVDSSVVAKALVKNFPPGTVTRAAWIVVLRPGVSSIATDVMLFHHHGARLVQQYCVYADPLPHRSLHGRFMLRLARFIIQASAEARSATTHDRDSRSESAPTLLRQAHRPGVGTPRVSRPPHREFVRHEGLSCPTGVRRGPGRTETALTNVVCND